MGDNTLREDILKEAVRIGDWLLSRVKKDSSGMWWECVTMDLDRKISWHESEGIYSGVSGISLFLLELHKRTGEAKYLAAAKEGMRWVIDYCKKNPGQYFAFFTGRMGVPYVLLKMAEATGEGHWRESALEIARPCSEFLESPGAIDDLINGRSGTILGLLHLHAATGEKWILETINTSVKHLVHSAYHGPKGFYWDRTNKAISGLCGFSHGAAGIGWVFMELGHYFQNQAFYRVAQQAFLYESCFYDDNRKNWQDLRKGTYTDEDEQNHRKAYMENDMAFFTTGGDMNAWCHGAAGIGLSRLRACELFKNDKEAYERYQKDVLAAIEKTTGTDVEAENPTALFILCHGGGGNAELFLQAYEFFNDKKYLALAEKVAQKALEFYKTHQQYFCGYRSTGEEPEDTSLYMGNAGVGYFYLRLLAPHDVPSILNPSLNTTCSGKQDLSAYPWLSISLPGAGKELLKKYFNRTLVMAETFHSRDLAKFLDETPLDIHNIPLKHSFVTFMDKAIASMPPKEQNCLSDVFILEKETLEMDEAIPSHSYLDIKQKVLNEKARELTELDNDDLMNLTLVLEPGTQIATTDWNWNPANQKGWVNNINLEPDIFPLVLKPTPVGVLEEVLSPLSYTILGGFEEANTVENVRKETIDAFEKLTPDQEKMLTGKIIEQIKQALLAGILIKG